MPLERLQKIIAAAGITSRRKAEELIQGGLVSVNGDIVTELGSKADPETDSIRVNNKPLKGAEQHEYVALNKPRGYVTTVSDPEGRPTVMELVRSKARLYPVGRLDFNSEGLLLLTNDGELTHKLMKAASHIAKTYLVKIAGLPAEDQLRRLRSGVSIAEERDPTRRVRTATAQIRVIKEADNPWLEVTLYEGRNRQIRKMFEEIGHHVEKIRRVRYGPLELDVPPGESRALTAREVARLQHATNPENQLRSRSEPRGRTEFREKRDKPPRRDFQKRDPERTSRKQFSKRPPHSARTSAPPAAADEKADVRRDARRPSVRRDDRRPSRRAQFSRSSDNKERPFRSRRPEGQVTNRSSSGRTRDAGKRRPNRENPRRRS
jgi:23S rRNA pseudouridine2605 synthase